jgi:SAM-dependent methyltransferase
MAAETAAPGPAVDYEDLWSHRWGDMQRYGPTSRHTRRIVARLLDVLDFSSVLDVGCGEGSALAHLHARYPSVRLAGTDVSAAAVARARVNCPYASFTVGDFSALPAAERFDLVTCFDVLEHVVDDVSFLRGLAAVSARRVLCATVQGRMRPEEAGIGHVRNYSRGELQGKMEEAGLKAVRTVEWGFPFYSPAFRSLVSATGSDTLSHGRYGAGRRLVCHGLYALFLLNSWRRGDRLYVLAERL